VLNMEQRKKDFEAATKVLIPTKDALSIISTRGHIYERNIAYTKGSFSLRSLGMRPISPSSCFGRKCLS